MAELNNNDYDSENLNNINDDDEMLLRQKDLNNNTHASVKNSNSNNT